MRIEFRARLEATIPSAEDVATSFMDEVVGNLSNFTGEAEGEYEVTEPPLLIGISRLSSLPWGRLSSIVLQTETNDTDGDDEQEIVVTVEFEVALDRVEGKFASKDDLGEQIIEEITGQTVEDSGITYTVTDVEIIDRKAEARAARG